RMLRAFREAKDRCYARLADPRQTALAWVQDLLEEQRALMGADPWPYALEPNRANLEALVRYSHNQGLIPRAPAIEELFVENALSESPRYVSYISRRSPPAAASCLSAERPARGLHRRSRRAPPQG